MFGSIAPTLLQIPSSTTGWVLWFQKWGPILLLISFLGLCAYILKWYMQQDPVRTIEVIGYDPRIPYFELREVELEGKEAVWVDPEGDNVRFVPKEQTQHGSAEGPGWLLDLTDGRTMRINESNETVRTTGQELEKAVKDQTIAQSLSTEEQDMMMYLKLALIAVPVIVLFLIVIAVGVFAG